jgi:glycosyltransferase involved in cell wall biosynthesis
MAGGERVAVYNLVRALTAFADLDVHVIYCHNDVEVDQTVERNGATIHYLALPRPKILPGYISSLWRIAKCQAAIQPDIVNAHESHYAIPALRAGVPVILTLHSSTRAEYEIYKGKLYDRVRYSLNLLYDRYALPRLRDIIAISPYVIREYHGQSHARWHRIDNPLPDDYFTLERHEQPGRILFAGSITPLKDIITLLRALLIVRRTQPQVRLRLAGRTTDAAYEQEVRHFINDHGLTGSVDIMGLLDMPAMMEEYAACSLVALPSRQEVLPMTMIEAMAVGAPVVATRAGGLVDLISDEETGLLVDIGDAEAMAKAILKLLLDDERRHAMGAAGRAIAQQRFRSAAVAGRYRQAYFDAIQAQGGSKR